MREYRRHLPHQIPADNPIFLTWNLKGAMPRDVIERLKRERTRLESMPQRKGESPRKRAIRNGKLIFARADDFLDGTTSGPLYLRDPECAQIVEDAVLRLANKNYTLWAWCVMANHVHVLLTPRDKLAVITQRLKGATSREINKLQNELGRTFWQDESYDHWARDDEELLRIIHYIENNPVKAKLCAQPGDWPWSSARLRDGWPAGTPYVGQASA